MKSKKIIKGLTILLIGLILLANTLEILDWSVWYNVFKLWPLLLISAGLSIIFRERTLSFLAPLVILLAIIAGVWTGYSDIELIKEVTPQEKILSREFIIQAISPPEENISLEIKKVTPESTSPDETETEIKTTDAMVIAPPISKTSLDLNFDVGSLIIQDSTNQLYECISRYRYKEFEPFEEYSSSDDEAFIYLAHAPVYGSFFSGNHKNNWHFTLNKDIGPISRRFITGNVNNSWNVKLNKDMIYNLHINSGAIDTECNLSDFKVDEFSLESGASNIKLILPEFDAKIMIDSGASNIVIGIPDNVGVILKLDTGISIKNLNDFFRENDTYTSSNYDEADFKTNIEIDCGISNINIYYM